MILYCALFIKHIEFRECFGLDTVLTDWQPPEVLAKFTPGGFFGEDREGHPVWFDRMGNLDFRGKPQALYIISQLLYRR